MDERPLRIYPAAMTDETPELDLHRSLSPTGFWVIMTILAVWSFVGGIVFLSVGAWPVIGCWMPPNVDKQK